MPEHSFQPFEAEIARRGYAAVCGVDEVGRGPLAGDVYAAAVILPEGWIPPGLNDSKQLTEKRRDALFESITAGAVAYRVASANLEEIARLNILGAALLAMRRAVEGLPSPAAFALVDGNRAPPLAIPCQTVVKGDALCASIAAASVLAKVSRDRTMLELDALYPQYGFARHKGYGTKAHYIALKEYGASPVHRLGFNLTKE
ncbi:MAG: ribonuclease HII [Oscillospiraceae bacterium]|nr:ribonuclease HII [Oscillospiraceae bacterium]